MLNIIVADDNNLVCQSIKESILLFFSKATIYCALDGFEVLNLINENNIDVVIMDIDMPNKNGLDTAIEIKNSSKKVKTICTSSYKSPEQLLNLRTFGVKGFIQKGCKPIIYKIAIETVMEDELFFEKPILELILQKGLDLKKVDNKEIVNKILLTNSETLVLKCLKKDLTNILISKELKIEISTVEKHLTNIYKKFNVKSREEIRKHYEFIHFLTN